MQGGETQTQIRTLDGVPLYHLGGDVFRLGETEEFSISSLELVHFSAGKTLQERVSFLLLWCCTDEGKRRLAEAQQL